MLPKEQTGLSQSQFMVTSHQTECLAVYLCLESRTQASWTLVYGSRSRAGCRGTRSGGTCRGPSCRSGWGYCPSSSTAPSRPPRGSPTEWYNYTASFTYDTAWFTNNKVWFTNDEKWRSVSTHFPFLDNWNWWPARIKCILTLPLTPSLMVTDHW